MDAHTHWQNYKQILSNFNNAFKKVARCFLPIALDGASFSTTGHVLAVLKYHKIGVLIREDFGGGYMCTDGSRRMKLKNTHLTLYCSTMSFRAATPGLTEGRGIMPDYEVYPNLAEYLGNVDSVKQKAIGLINKID